MVIFVVTGSQGEYSDRHDWNICAFHSEEEAQTCVSQLDELQQFNQEFYKSFRAEKDEINRSCPIPVGPSAPAPSNEFRLLQQAVANGKGSPETKAAFRKAQAEHIQNIDKHKEKLIEWIKVKDSISSLQDQKAKDWFEMNYNPPLELASVRKYSNFDSKASYYRSFDVRYSYEETELHEPGTI